MKQVLYTEQAINLLEEDVRRLVEGGYFSEEDYAVEYIRNILQFFALNFNHLTSSAAPEFFKQFSMSEHPLQYVKYCKSRQVTWYAFFEELAEIYSVVYVANNRLIGHHLDS